MGFRLKVYILLACKLLFLYKRINCRKTAKERVFKQQGFIASFAACCQPYYRKSRDGYAYEELQFLLY